jgi:hypothetical protein
MWISGVHQWEPESSSSSKTRRRSRYGSSISSFPPTSRTSNAMKQTAGLDEPRLRNHSAAKSGLPLSSRHTISPSRITEVITALANPWSSG